MIGFFIFLAAVAAKKIRLGCFLRLRRKKRSLRAALAAPAARQHPPSFLRRSRKNYPKPHFFSPKQKLSLTFVKSGKNKIEQPPQLSRKAIKIKHMPHSVNRMYHVLLVEDNPGDVLLMQEVFRHSQRQVTLHVAGDGEQAMDFVRKNAAWRDAPTPDLILMDLNLPRYDGWEVLRNIKASPVLCRIPVVVLTTSAAPRDVLLSYDLHANSFVTKPVDFDQFVEIMRNIETFWLSTSLLPTNL